MGIEIDIPEIENFDERVIEAVARYLLYSTVQGDGERDDGYTVETQLQRKVRDQMLEVVREQARAAAPDIVKMILSGEVMITDEYGYGRGKSKTVAELIAETVKEAAHNGSNGRRGQSVLAQFITEEVKKQFRAELQEVLDSAKAPVLEAVRVQASNVIEAALANALKVVGSK